MLIDDDVIHNLNQKYLLWYGTYEILRKQVSYVSTWLGGYSSVQSSSAGWRLTTHPTYDSTLPTYLVGRDTTIYVVQHHR